MCSHCLLIYVLSQEFPTDWGTEDDVLHPVPRTKLRESIYPNVKRKGYHLHLPTTVKLHDHEDERLRLMVNMIKTVTLLRRVGHSRIIRLEYIERMPTSHGKNGSRRLALPTSSLRYDTAVMREREWCSQ